MIDRDKHVQNADAYVNAYVKTQCQYVHGYWHMLAWTSVCIDTHVDADVTAELS